MFSASISYKIISLDAAMPFGKYKGRVLKDILNFDPQYLKWAIEETDRFALSRKDVQLILDRAYDQRYDEY